MTPSPCLMLRSGAWLCAVPLRHVVEILRPLPVEGLTGTPVFVRGLSVIRGAPTPVVDLGAVLGGDPGGAARFVVLRLGGRRVALAVDAVLGTSDLSVSAMEDMPPLLRNAASQVVQEVGVLDAQLLVVLREARLVPDEVWPVLAAQGGGP